MNTRIWIPAEPEDDFDILVQAKDRGGQHIAVVERDIDFETLANLLAKDDIPGGPPNMLAELDDDVAEAYRGEARRYVAALGIGDEDGN